MKTNFNTLSSVATTVQRILDGQDLLRLNISRTA